MNDNYFVALSLELPSDPTITVERKKFRQEGRCEVSVNFLCKFEIPSANVIFQVTWGANDISFYYEEVMASPARLSTDILQQHGLRYGIDVSRYLQFFIMSVMSMHPLSMSIMLTCVHLT